MRDADFSVPLSLALLFNVKNQRDLGVSSIGHIPSKQAKERRESRQMYTCQHGPPEDLRRGLMTYNL